MSIRVECLGRTRLNAGRGQPWGQAECVFAVTVTLFLRRSTLGYLCARARAGAGLGTGAWPRGKWIYFAALRPREGTPRRFLGDEICCMDVSCWASALSPVVAKLRAFQRCYTPTSAPQTWANWVGCQRPWTWSVQMCKLAFSPARRVRRVRAREGNGQAECVPQSAVAPAVNADAGCVRQLECVLLPSCAQLVHKLQLYFEWARQQPRIAGFMPWPATVITAAVHNTRPHVTWGWVRSRYQRRYILNESLLGENPP